MMPGMLQYTYLMRPSKVLLLVNSVISSLGLCYEGISIANNGLKEHFNNILNILDFAGFTAGIVWNICMFRQEFQCTLVSEQGSEEKFYQCGDLNDVQEVAGWLKLTNIVWTMAINLRAMDVFSLFAATRQLSSILRVGASDSIPFMAIVLFIMYLFGIIFQYQAYLSKEVV